ncbi:MAG: STAS domain-containing protein [Acidimicrobiales bacterium]
MRPFAAEVLRQNGSVLVRLVGDLDLATVPDLHLTVACLFGEPLASLTVDLTDLAFVDLTGLRALAIVGDTVSEGGVEFHLVGVNDYVSRLIRLADLDGLQRACGMTLALRDPSGGGVSRA